MHNKRIYYGPRASLIFSCGKDEFLSDSGFPLPEIEIEIGGGTDASQLAGLLSWDNGIADYSQVSVVGPITRSLSFDSASASVSAIVPGA